MCLALLSIPSLLDGSIIGENSLLIAGIEFYSAVFYDVFLFACVLAEQLRVLVYYPILFCGELGRMT